MRVPAEWLKELIRYRASSEQVAQMLTMAGLETVVLPGDVLEIDVLPNRSDCLSIRGIAREISAVTKFRLSVPGFKVNEISAKTKDIVKVVVRDQELCPRYMARMIKNVQIMESPAWLQKRLGAAGIRLINNIVDVTNYLLLELGQPMHAFDASLLNNQTIIVRRAAPGEKIITLDGKEHVLDKSVLLIADKEQAIAVAGVMGAANTEINAKTKTVILESAYFDPISIHKTSKLLKLRSESSVRFEHGVDWDVVEEALDRGAAMIAELSKGHVLKGKIDVKGKLKQSPKAIILRPDRVNQLLGTAFTLGEMANILKSLGFDVNGQKVEAPLYRSADIYREIDLIEEIARLYGYSKIRATLPNTAFAGKGVDLEDLFRGRVREIMAGCGLNEVQTYSMVGPKDFERTGASTEQAIKVANPMNVEEGYMRTSILPSLLNVVVHNTNRQVENVFIFEIGKTFTPSAEKLPAEKWVLCVVACGSPFLSALDGAVADYSYLKGMLENLLGSLGMQDFNIMEAKHHLLQPGKGAEIAGLGIMGELHPDIRRNYDLEKMVCFLEIDLNALFQKTLVKKKYQPLPKYPSVSRDVAMYVPKALEHKMIVATVKKVGGELVEDVSLFDRFKDSLAYRIVYRDPGRTLTDELVNKKHEEVVKALESKLNVRIRK